MAILFACEHVDIVYHMYRMAGLLSILPVGEDMEQLLNYYFNIMQMSTSVRRYESVSQIHDKRCHTHVHIRNTIPQHHETV